MKSFTLQMNVFFGKHTVFSFLKPVSKCRFFIVVLTMIFFHFQGYLYAQAPGGVSAGLSLWVKADQGVMTTGSNVTAWNDQSSGNRHLTTTTATYQPQAATASAGFNFNPAVYFNGDFLRYTANVIPANSGASVFSVVNQTSASGYNTVWDFIANDPTLNTYGGQWLIYHGGAGNRHSIPATPGKTILVNGHWQHNLSVSSLLEVNGKAEPVSRAITTNGNNYYLGAGSAGAAEPWRGYISENIVYNTPLSGTDLQRVNSYLAIKYGITLDSDPADDLINYNYLSSSGIVIWDGTANASYHHDITGIGRDDNSALLQLRSKSINAGSVITMEAGSIITDESFTIIGDNAASAGFIVPYTPGSFTSAIPYFHSGRIWKVQETGTIGTVTISVNAGNATHLLIHSTDNFSSGTPVEVPLINGEAQVDLLDGQFFTFAGPATAPGGVIENLAVWLRADEGTSTNVNGAAVSSWLDQSGNSRTHAQTTASSQPAYVGAGGSYLMNYNPALRFRGVGNLNVNNSYLTVPNYLDPSDAYHVFTVSRIDGAGPTSWQTVYSFRADLDHPDWYIQQVSARVNGVEKVNNSKNIKYAISAALIPKTGQQRVIWNGTTQSFTNTAYSITTSLSPDFSLGVDRNNTDPFTGDIQEVIVYTGPAGADIPNDHVARIQSYLAIKYGITLDPAEQPDYIAGDGSTVFWTGAVNAGYQHHIFGIGRDDNSSLYQKQAYSYSDSSIAIYLGTLAALNTVNTATVEQNNSYLVLGNNDLNGYTPAEYPAGTVFQNGTTTERINVLSNKIWKAQATTISNWELNVKTTRFKTAKYIMVSGNEAFTPATTRIYQVVNEHAMGVEINDGEYVRIASFNTAPGGVYTNLALWVKADAGVNGIPVEEWMDHSGNGNDMIQESAAYRPSYSPAAATGNFNRALTFSAHSLYRQQSFVPNTSGTGISVFSVARSTTVTGGYHTLWDFSVNNPTLNTRNAVWDFYTMGGDHILPVVSGKSNIASTHWIIGSSGSRVNEIDGYAEVKTGVVAAPSLNDYLLGAGNRTNNEPWVGDIFENIVYTTKIVNNDLLKVNTYLAVKYGITLRNPATYQYTATDGTVVWDGSGNAAFHNNVAGIGRDDVEELHQKQSVSINPGNQIIIGLRNIEASNADNVNSFENDISYLIWGDNGVTTNTTTEVLYTTNVYVNHLNRIWRVENKGVSQQVMIRFPAALQPGVLSSPCDMYKLITANDGTITAASITSISSVTEEGGEYIAEINFPAGVSYFTLARVDPSSGGVVYLPEESTQAINFSECTDTDWKYFYEDALQERKLFAAADFTSGELADLSVSITTSGATFASPARETNIMPRITTVTGPAGTTYAGGRVRIYYDETELNNSQITGAITNGWFKYSGDAVGALADILDNGVFVSGMAVAITPDASGTEDGIAYVEFHNITSFSSFLYISSTEPEGVVLPVTLEKFTAVKNANTIRLDWTTASEYNNKGFEIEKALPNGQWKIIGFIASATRDGSSNTIISYSYTDEQPDAGTNSYRLKQIDFDGRYMYSNIVFVSYNSDITITVAPNPVISTTMVKGVKTGDRVHLFNQSGQLIYTSAVSNDQLILDMSAYTPGLYHLQVIRDMESITFKIIKGR